MRHKAHFVLDRYQFHHKIVYCLFITMLNNGTHSIIQFNQYNSKNVCYITYVNTLSVIYVHLINLLLSSNKSVFITQTMDINIDFFRVSNHDNTFWIHCNELNNKINVNILKVYFLNTAIFNYILQQKKKS